MSSEESEAEGVIMKRSLPWRSSKVSKFFYSLDKQIESTKSTQSKRQTIERVLVSEISSRPRPGGKFPSWAVVSESDV